MKKKILIVDDMESMLKLISSALRDEFETLTAKSAEMALEIIKVNRPELILLDIMLPGMSGNELCTELKNHNSYKDIPIIMISSRSGPKARALAYEIGAHHYLEKPFELTELRAMIHQTLGLKKSDHNSIISFKKLNISLLNQSADITGERIELTNSEFKILARLIKYPEKIFSRTELLDLVSPDNLDITERTIDNHISTLRKKIKDSEITIKAIYSKGYKIE